MNNFVLLHPLVKTWEGAIKLVRERDLPNEHLPPKGAVTDGQVRLIHPESIAGPRAVRKALQRALAAAGTSLGGVYIVPAQSMPELSPYEAKFREKVTEVVERLSANMEAWAVWWETNGAKHWADHLRALHAQVSPKWVQARYRFRITKVPIGEGDPLIEDVKEDVLQDIRREAGEIAKEMIPHLRMERRFTRRTLRPVYDLLQKIKGFAIAYPECAIIAEVLQDALSVVHEDMPLDLVVLEKIRGALLTITINDR